MLKYKNFNTTIRIQKKTTAVSSTGFPTETWTDLIPTDIPCAWQNKFGSESWRQEMLTARDPATVRLWYIPDVDTTCRIVRGDGGVFEIVHVDNVEQWNIQLELEVRRYVEG